MWVVSVVYRSAFVPTSMLSQPQPQDTTVTWTYEATSSPCCFFEELSCFVRKKKKKFKLISEIETHYTHLRGKVLNLWKIWCRWAASRRVASGRVTCFPFLRIDDHRRFSFSFPTVRVSCFFPHPQPHRLTQHSSSEFSGFYDHLHPWVSSSAPLKFRSVRCELRMNAVHWWNRTEGRDYTYRLILFRKNTILWCATQSAVPVFTQSRKANPFNAVLTSLASFTSLASHVHEGRIYWIVLP